MNVHKSISCWLFASPRVLGESCHAAPQFDRRILTLADRFVIEARQVSRGMVVARSGSFWQEVLDKVLDASRWACVGEAPTVTRSSRLPETQIPAPARLR